MKRIYFSFYANTGICLKLNPNSRSISPGQACLYRTVNSDRQQKPTICQIENQEFPLKYRIKLTNYKQIAKFYKKQAFLRLHAKTNI